MHLLESVQGFRIRFGRRLSGLTDRVHTQNFLPTVAGELEGKRLEGILLTYFQVCVCVCVPED